MGELAGILNIFGFVATIAITILFFLLIYFGVILLNQLKSLLVFISRQGIFATPEELQSFFKGAFTFKEMLLLMQLRDTHKFDESGKPIGKQYGFMDMETEDTRNINLFSAKITDEKYISQ